MNKFLVSSIAVLTCISAASADCACKDGGCNKAKKQRVIYITAAEPEQYGEPVFSDIVVPNPCGDPACGAAVEPEPVAAVKLPAPVKADNDLAYVGLRAGVHMQTWRNEYSAMPSTSIIDPDADHDSYIFEPVFGGGIFIGRHFGESWRGDVEFGYMTEFSDSDNGFTFKMSTPYLTANAYYDFLGGFYLGGGAGFAVPKATLDWEWFNAGGASESRLSFMGALSAGFSRPLVDSIVLDIRYRLSGFYGPKWTRTVMQPGFQNAGGTDITALETRVGFVLDNAISVGLRYEF